MAESGNPENEATVRRQALVTKLAEAGIGDRRVLAAVAKVPRHRFVPVDWAADAYLDEALPIGQGQTISQPYVVAFMTELLEVESAHRVLEIGTGSGYQTAILAELAGQVFSVELLPELAKEACRRLDAFGYENVRLRCGDASGGWAEEAPFDRILVTAAAPRLPEVLVDQLARGGRLVVPIDERYRSIQWVWLITKDQHGVVSRERRLPVSFVPMEGEIRSHSDRR